MSNDLEEVDPLVGVRAGTGVPLATGGFQRVFPGMRKARRRLWERPLGREGQSNCFHVMSRITDGLPFFGETEKEALVILLWKMARFCKVRILTYCVMGNHFHALIEVPDAETVRAPFRERSEEGEDVGMERLLTHLGCLYSKKYVAALRQELENLAKARQTEEIEAVREAFLKRMGDMSRFVWEVKERFTKWYNKYHGRRGSLWNGRYKSVLVQGHEDSADADGGYSKALRTMAAYIDLNPVRAELVEDPADYRWCGYAAALAGSRRARRGINYLMGCGLDAWEADGTDERYRLLLLRHGLTGVGGDDEGEGRAEQRREVRRLHAEVEAKAPILAKSEEQKASRAALSEADWEEEAEADFAKAGHRGMTRGYALGAKDWVERVFERHRGHFGEKRRRGGKRFDVKGLFTLRQVRRE